LPFIPCGNDRKLDSDIDVRAVGRTGRERARTWLVPAGRGWVLSLTRKRLIAMGIAIGDEVSVELAPEGPQRGDLADDIAAALAASPRNDRGHEQVTFSPRRFPVAACWIMA
jgi:hypothetical protein